MWEGLQLGPKPLKSKADGPLALAVCTRDRGVPRQDVSWREWRVALLLWLDTGAETPEK